MKKVLSTLVATSVLATGTVAFSTASANAASVSFSATPFGDQAPGKVDFLLEEVGSDVKFTVTVDSSGDILPR